jgi:hypothetical protein
MLRANLSTRPFYNDRAVRVGWLLRVVAGATVVNVSRILATRAALPSSLQASRDGPRHGAPAGGGRPQRSVDTANRGSSIELLANDPLTAHVLLTALFNTFESTLPASVRITAVRRSSTTTGTSLALPSSRGVDDVDAFMEKQDFRAQNLLSRDEFVDDGGQLVAAIETTYLPTAPVPDAPTAPGGPAPAPDSGPEPRGGGDRR